MARVMLVNWWSKTARVVECDPAEVAKANGLTLEVQHGG